MNTLKTVFLAALLSAAAYGVYFAVNGPPRTQGGGTDWEPGPPVVVTSEGPSAPPEVTGDSAGKSGETSATGSEPPPFNAAAADGSAVLALPPADGAHSLAEEGAAPSDQRYPATESYSPDRMPLGPDDAQDDVASETRAAPDRYPSTDRYADRYSGAAGGAEADRYPPTDAAGANEALAAADPAGDTAPADDVHAEFATLMQSTDQMLRDGRLAEAHLELSSLYGTPGLTLDEEGRLTDLLDRLAGTVIYSRQHLLHPAYEVQPGDTLERIADAYEVPWQLLANINGIHEPGRLRPGDTLKVVKGPFDAYVDLSSFRLVLYVNGRYAGRFPIGIGKDRATPLGDFPVVKKVENPVYYGDQVVPAGDPNNPFGPYALDLDKGIFIHGTNDPNSIGRAESRGCIRLNNRDIKDLFEILTAKSEHSAGSHVSIIQSAAEPAASEPAPSGPILPPAETAGRPPAAPGSQRPSRL